MTDPAAERRIAALVAAWLRADCPFDLHPDALDRAGEGGIAVVREDPRRPVDAPDPPHPDYPDDPPRPPIRPDGHAWRTFAVVRRGDWLGYRYAVIRLGPPDTWNPGYGAEPILYDDAPRPPPDWTPPRTASELKRRTASGAALYRAWWTAARAADRYAPPFTAWAALGPWARETVAAAARAGRAAAGAVGRDGHGRRRQHRAVVDPAGRDPQRALAALRLPPARGRREMGQVAGRRLLVRGGGRHDADRPRRRRGLRGAAAVAQRRRLEHVVRHDPRYDSGDGRTGGALEPRGGGGRRQRLAVVGRRRGRDRLPLPHRPGVPLA